MTVADELRAAPLTSGLSDEQLAELLAVGEERHFHEGEELFEEGRPANVLWILLEGEIALSRRSGNQRVPVATMSNRGQWAGGLTAWAPEGADTGYRASGRAASDGRAFVLPSDELSRLVSTWLPFAKHLVTGVYGTIRSIDATARELAKLAALGEHAARLAHELNNPAAAAVRAADRLNATCDEMLSRLAALGGVAGVAGALATLDDLRQQLTAAPASSAGVARMDLEDEVATWLAARGVDPPWDLASTFVAAGADLAWLGEVEAAVGADNVGAAVRWIATTLDTRALLGELVDATARVSRLVDVSRSYTQMDRAPLQDAVVHEGIESTMRMLAASLKDVRVERDYAADTPISAFVSELNQVWTNLITNAVDAMGGSGVLRVATRRDGDDVVVEITDDGPGMPPDVLARVFEPFFTTKEAGAGTGLGLDITRRIVVDRHGGEIAFESVPGATTARVRLPRHR